MPAGITAVIDNFNRADGGLGANWLANPRHDGSPALAISSNQVRVGGASATYSSSAYTAATYGADCEVYVTLATGPSASGNTFIEIGLRFRQTSSSASTADGYSVSYNDNGTTATLQISRWDNCVETILAGPTSVARLATGDKLCLQAIGSNLQAYRYTSGAWSAYGPSATDATYSAAGNLLIACYEDTRTVLFDDFGGGTIFVDTGTAGGAVGAGTAPTAAVAATNGASVGGGTAGVPSAALTPAGSVGSGSAPTARATTTPGGSVGSSPTPTASVPVTTAGSVGSGTGPVSSAQATAGAALGSGTGPAATVPATVAAAVGAGTGPTAAVSITPGAAVGSGASPTDTSSTSDNAPAGGAVGSGTAPTAAVSEVIAGGVGSGAAPGASAGLTVGAAVGSGTGPKAAASATPASSVGAGTAPTAAEAATPAGSMGSGTAPVSAATGSPGGSVGSGSGPGPAAGGTAGGSAGGGSAPSAWVTVSVGGAIGAANTTTGALVLITPAGAIAGGTAPGQLGSTPDFGVADLLAIQVALAMAPVRAELSGALAALDLETGLRRLELPVAAAKTPLAVLTTRVGLES